MADRPRRAYQLTIEIGADDWESLIDQIDEILLDLELDGYRWHGENEGGRDMAYLTKIGGQRVGAVYRDGDLYVSFRAGPWKPSGGDWRTAAVLLVAEELHRCYPNVPRLAFEQILKRARRGWYGSAMHGRES